MTKPFGLPLEQQLFTWENWDIIDHSTMQFKDCKLQRAIGEYKEGADIPVIVLSLEDSTLQFLTKEGQTLNEYNLLISIAEEEK